MAEQFPQDSYLEGLSGATDTQTGVYYPVKGEGLDWYVSFVKCIYRLIRNVSVVSGLRVYKTGDLVCGVKAGWFYDGNTLREVTVDEAVSLTDNATNYLYLLTNGTLTVNTTGFPDPASTNHIRLGTVETSGGTYTDDDITDWRDRHVFQLAGPISNIADDAVDSDQIADDAVTSAQLADDAVDTGHLHDNIADLITKIDINVGSESSDTIAVTIQVQDVQGNSNANRFLVHAWLADSQYGAETSTAPDGTVSFTTGTQLEEITAKKRWTAITDATGQAVLSIGESDAETWYLNVELDGRIYAGSAITFAV